MKPIGALFPKSVATKNKTLKLVSHQLKRFFLGVHLTFAMAPVFTLMKHECSEA
jgi:hypothetical protein